LGSSSSRKDTSWISATDFVQVGVGAAPAALAHEGLDDPAGSTAVFAAKSFFCNVVPKGIQKPSWRDANAAAIKAVGRHGIGLPSAPLAF
jgi:hypothetical protein